MGKEPSSPPRDIRARQNRGVIFKLGGSPPVLPGLLGLSGARGLIKWGGSPPVLPGLLWLSDAGVLLNGERAQQSSPGSQGYQGLEVFSMNSEPTILL